MKKKCCKHLCKTCYYFYIEQLSIPRCSSTYGSDSCSKVLKTETDCVTGKETEIRCNPHVMNKNGGCKHYKEDKDIMAKEKMLKALDKWISYREDKNFGCSYDIDAPAWDILDIANCLKDLLENPKDSHWILDKINGKRWFR